MTAARTRRSLALLTPLLAMAAIALRLDPEPPAPAPRVEASADAGGATSLGRFVITARWGRTESARSTAPDRLAAAAPLRWDGELRIDCGSIESVLPLGMEIGDTAAAGDDETLPTRRIEGGRGEALPFRSTTRDGWDGMRVVVRSCDDQARGATVTLATQQRRFAARLDWSTDDFVALPVGTAGDALEVHTAAALDPRSHGRSRLTAAGDNAVAMR